MAQTAAHLADHVIPPVPVRQLVISVPRRLRGILADRPAVKTVASPASAACCRDTRRSGAVRLVLDAQAEKTQACHSGSTTGSGRASPLHAIQKIGNGRLANRFDDRVR